jgi:hypothetical protein
MEESKQNTWMWCDRIALLREGESPLLPNEEREEEKGVGSLNRPFLYHLECEGGEMLRHHLTLLTCGLRG